MSSACMMQTNYAKANQYQYNNMLILQQQQSITPAATKVLGNSNLQNIQPVAGGVGSTMAKRKYTYANMPYGEQLPSVARRNARERNRVKQVNNGFANLRQHLPQSVINNLSNGGRGASKKLSKVDTLRIAVEYIRGLSDMLDSTGCSTKHHDASNENYDFALDSPCSENEAQYQTQNFNSETSASPAPSYSGSDISNGGANYFQPLKLESEPLQFKFEPFDNYNSFSQEEQPDDEELLDYISSWQEQ